MSDEQSLVIKLRVDDTGAVRVVEQDLQRMGRAGQQAGKSVSSEMSAASRSAELLGTAAKTALAYFSVSAVTDFARGVFTAGIAMDSLTRSMSAIFATGSAVTANFEYLRAESERLGQNFYDLAPAYRSIAAAARGTVMEGENTRKIFSAITEAGTALGLNGAEVEGALRAIGQMMSKGTVQAEELRGQLGERLPGAFKLMADAMGVSQQELNKMLDKGEVLSSVALPKLADVIHRTYGEAAETAGLKSGQAAVNRLSQEWTDFKNNLSNTDAATAGIDAVTESLRTLNAMVLAVHTGRNQYGEVRTIFDGLGRGDMTGVEGGSTYKGRVDRKSIQVADASITGDSFISMNRGLDSASERAAKYLHTVEDGHKALTKYIQTEQERAKAAYDEAVKYASTPEERARALETYQKAIGTRGGSGGNSSIDLDNYGTSALSSFESQSRRELDILQAKLDEESAISRAAYDADQKYLERYYASRANIIQQKSAAEIAAQRALIEKSESEISRLNNLTTGGKRGDEQVSDQIRSLNESIADAQAKITVLQTDARTAMVQVGAEHARAKLEYISSAVSDAQSVISSTEQSMQSRIAAGLETEATAREKIRLVTQSQAQLLRNDLIPSINDAMSAATNPAKRAELEAMLSKIAELQEEGRKKGWTDGLIQGVRDYATEATDAFSTAQDAASQAMSSMEDALVEFVTTGKMEFSDLAESIIADLARIAIQQNITQPLASGLSNVIGNLFSGGWTSASTTDASILGNSGFGLAKGGVVDGGVHPWVNTVQASPKYFDASGFRPFALGGVFGEAGPEAVMPLARTSSGELGVKSSGSSGTVVNVYNNATGTQATTTERQENGVNIIDVLVEQVDNSLAAKHRNGQSTFGNMLTRQGLSRATGAYR